MKNSLNGFRTVSIILATALLVTLGFVPPAQAAGVQSALLFKAMPVAAIPGDTFTKLIDFNWDGQGYPVLSSVNNGTGNVFVYDTWEIDVNGKQMFSHDFTQNCAHAPAPEKPLDLTDFISKGMNHLRVKLIDHCGNVGNSPIYLVGSGTISSPSSDCGTAKFFGVRGSGEHSGYGPTMQVLQQSLNKSVPGLQTESISYWAIDVDFNITHVLYPSDYVNSVFEGRTILENSIRAYLAQCPGKFVVIGGYSQGAEVVRQAFLDLSSKQRDQVAAVALFGDPLFNPNDKTIDRGNALWYQGIDMTLLGDRPSRIPAPWNQRFEDYCQLGDPVCNFDPVSMGLCVGGVITKIAACPHTWYVKDRWVAKAVPSIIKALKTHHVL